MDRWRSLTRARGKECDREILRSDGQPLGETELRVLVAWRQREQTDSWRPPATKPRDDAADTAAGRQLLALTKGMLHRCAEEAVREAAELLERRALVLWERTRGAHWLEAQRELAGVLHLELGRIVERAMRKAWRAEA